MADKPDVTQQIDHRLIKLLIGLIAVFMAFFMQWAAGRSLSSISESYYTRAGDWFVGLLFAEAALFLSFKGDRSVWFERGLTVVASMCAAVVAVAPCGDCGHGSVPVSVLHYPAAGSLFAILGYFCWRFRKTASGKFNQYPEARQRAKVYAVCLAGMVGCAALAVMGMVVPEIDKRYPNHVFWMEALGLVSFGFSWLAASRTIPLITGDGERYRLSVGRAPDDP